MSLRKGIFITAYNRADYFAETMNSWRKVRNLRDWHMFIRLEPSSFESQHREIIYESGLEDHVTLVVNPEVYGVLHHPWVGFDEMFRLYFDFVIRAEDDLIVSDDILEYFDWAAETYHKDKRIGAVLGFSEANGPSDEVHRVETFNPWVWGTWHDRWESTIRDTWDHDYSTFNGEPGNESGWDWNLQTRVFPSKRLKSIQPLASRVQNVGEWGVHGTPENLKRSPSFSPLRPPVDYVER